MSEPTTVPVLLMECFLAGFQYHQAQKYWDHLPIGESLALVREPGNPHDPRAVRVDWLGATLGYLPRDANFTAAQMLDREEYLEARIAGKRPGGDPKTRILLQVILLANPDRGLGTLYDSTPEKERPELHEKELPAPPPRLVDPASEYNASPPTPSNLILGLAWMLAGKAIGKAKGLPAKR